MSKSFEGLVLKDWSGIHTISDRVTEEEAKQYRYDIVLPLPKRSGTYQKDVVECAINLLGSMLDGMRPSQPTMEMQEQGRTEHDIPVEMLNQLRHVSNTLRYMVNCNSWLQGVAQPYDTFEICRRFEMASKIR